MKSNGFIASLMLFGTRDLHVSPRELIWDVPMSQIVLLMRQKRLEDDPESAWSFAEEEIVRKAVRAGAI